MAPAPTARKPRERIFYLDFIRALATFLIVLTHFNNPYLSQGGYLLTNEPFGIYVGNLGVSLFFVISGAALAYTYRRPINLRRFYWKRFTGIYPMFWIAWILGTLYFFVTRNGVPINAGPAKSVIFSLFAVDGMVANAGVHTTYLLGEWFLGFILIFYAFFPLLLWAIEKHPVITAVVVLALYAVSLVFLPGHSLLPMGLIFTVRLPELCCGIYIMKYLPRIPVWTLIPAVVVLVVSALRPQLDENLATTCVGISTFFVLAVLSRWIDVQPVRVLVGSIAKYSYPIFLVHHVVIMDLYYRINTGTFQTPLQPAMMFIAVLVITFALAVALYHLEKATLRYTRTLIPTRAKTAEAQA